METIQQYLQQYQGEIFKLNNSPFKHNCIYYIIDNLNNFTNYLKKKYEPEKYTRYYKLIIKDKSHIFTENNGMINNEIYFTSDNIMTNIKTGQESLVNTFNYIHKKYLSTMCILNNKTLFNKCMKDYKNNTPNLLLTQHIHNITKQSMGYRIQYINNINLKLSNKNISKKNKDNLLKSIEKFFNKKTSIKFKEIKLKCNKDDDCCICMNNLKDEDCLKFPCDHYIHYNCALEWSKKTRIESCPYCRYEI